MAPKQKIVVVGAGPVGSLAALYAAQRGHEVEIYELRPGESMYLFFSHQIQGSLSRDTTTDEPEGDGSMHSC
jgi:kynurenine 3-monooxygenase